MDVDHGVVLGVCKIGVLSGAMVAGGESSDVLCGFRADVRKSFVLGVARHKRMRRGKLSNIIIRDLKKNKFFNM